MHHRQLVVCPTITSCVHPYHHIRATLHAHTGRCRLRIEVLPKGGLSGTHGNASAPRPTEEAMHEAEVQVHHSEMPCIAAVRFCMQHIYNSRPPTHRSSSNRICVCVAHSTCHTPRRRQALGGPHLCLHHALLRMGDSHTMHSRVSSQCIDYPSNLISIHRITISLYMH